MTLLIVKYGHIKCVSDSLTRNNIQGLKTIKCLNTDYNETSLEKLLDYADLIG